MKKVLALSALTLLAVAPMARTQSMEPMALINRMQSNYRSLDSYKDTAVWTHKQGEKEFKAEITLAMTKPNKYLFEMKGDRLNTTVVSDGKTLLAYRPDRKAYTRTTAPVRITGANVLDKIEQPSAGTRIITALLQANMRDLDPQWQFNLSRARVSGPHDFGGKLAYTLTFPYTSEFDAKVYVTTGDFLVRRVQLLADSTPVITEDRMNIERNGKIEDSVFVKTLPELAKSVVSLPPLPDYTIPAESAIASGEWGNAPDFTVDTAEGGRFTLSKLKGKAILLNFFFNTWPPCRAEFPHLVELYNEKKRKGLEIVSVNVRDAGPEVLQFMQEFGATHTAVINRTRADVAKLYGVRATPTNVVIDRNGNIVDSILGANMSRIQRGLAKAGVD